MTNSNSQSKDDGIVKSALAPSVENRTRMIAEAAYFRAQRRSFEPGHEMEDWLAAENWLAPQNWLATEVEGLRNPQNAAI